MKRKALIAVTLTMTAISCCGCFNSRQTKGYQANSPLNPIGGLTQNTSNQNQGNGINKFFSGLTGQKQNQPPRTESTVAMSRDATSLQAPATVSADLLIVAGEMGLEQQRYDLAKNYFERALKIDPNNARAQSGLSRAAGRTGPPASANRQNGQPQNQELINSFGQQRPRL